MFHCNTQTKTIHYINIFASLTESKSVSKVFLKRFDTYSHIHMYSNMCINKKKSHKLLFVEMFLIGKFVTSMTPCQSLLGKYGQLFCI